MKETLEIVQKQQLAQRLSPRQVQYARLLEMTAPEVEEEVRRQLDDNPALEAAEPIEPVYEEAPVASEDYSDPDDDPADRYMPRSADENTFSALQLASGEEDLLDSLSEQIGELELSPTVSKAARYIAGNLDENGYLTRTLRAMADDMMLAGFDVTDEQMREAFAVVRSLDPAGIGAVDLRDCLLLQLQRVDTDDKSYALAVEIVKDYFDLLSKKHYDRLQANLGIKDREELRDAVQVIRNLNPKPGSALAAGQMSMRTSHIVPDVAVETLDDGRFSVSLVSSLPQLQIEHSFSAEQEEATYKNKREKEAQAFIKLKREDAEAFISALKQRGTTLMRVTEAIVRRQPEFFTTADASQLHPMILKDIAKDTGYDLSAISRATAGKYVATQMGTFPLKMFFNEAPREDSDTSSHQLMQVLKDIVDGEDKKHPLSDQAILEELKKQGYDIARRTITKYREKLGIPVGRLRKKI